jgi:hypothetical protein
MAGRPKRLPSTKAVHILLPEETVEALDAWVVEAQATLPGGSGITRADLIRDLLRRAVAERAASKRKR